MDSFGLRRFKSKFHATRQLADHYQSEILGKPLGDDKIQFWLGISDYNVNPNILKSHQWSSDDYLNFRKKVVAIAKESQNEVLKNDLPFNPSFGGEKSAEARTRFDQKLSVAILDILPITPNEASSDDVWSYLTLRVIPDVAYWRYPNHNNDTSYRRYLGAAPRNAFRRLWTRAYLAGPEIGLLAAITEDQAVALFERTNLVQYPPIAQACLRALVALTSENTNNDLYREAAKKIGRISSVRTLEIYSREDLDALVTNVFSG